MTEQQPPRPRVRMGPSVTVTPTPAPAPTFQNPEPPAEMIALMTPTGVRRIVVGGRWEARGEADPRAQRIVRPSGTYCLPDGAMALVPPVDVRVAFPTTFAVENLRGAVLPATVFAQRGGDFPLWLDFLHPLDGRWRAAFARAEWIQPR